MNLNASKWNVEWPDYFSVLLSINAMKRKIEGSEFDPPLINKQELQQVLKFQIEIFWNLEARNLKLDFFHF